VHWFSFLELMLVLLSQWCDFELQLKESGSILFFLSFFFCNFCGFRYVSDRLLVFLGLQVAFYFIWLLCFRLDISGPERSTVVVLLNYCLILILVPV
jgi:hypothetical protein